MGESPNDRETLPRAGTGPNGATLSPLTFAGDSLSIVHLDSQRRTVVKRKSGKAMLDIDDKVKVVHFNVGSGYVSYLEEEEPGSKPRVRGILLDKGKDSKKRV